MPDKLLIITPYPSQVGVYDNEYSALASFAKNTVNSMVLHNKKLRILILADKIPRGKNWQSKNITVNRVWSRNNIFTYLSLILEIIKNSSYKKILIELEWGLLGKNPLIIGLWPIYILILKLLKKDVTIVLHGIVFDFMKLSPQLGFHEKSFKTSLFNIGIKMFYHAIIKLSDRIIVLEKYFADQIQSYYQTEKVSFIPHGIDTHTVNISKTKARKILGLKNNKFVILNFGFINWYKGSDIIVDLFQDFIDKKSSRQKNVQLVMAGGISNIHNKNLHYRKYSEKILSNIAVSQDIKLTGYLEEKDIGLYYIASDLIILPYRLFISSSGPLSFAIAYKKPFILSENLSGYFYSPDFKKGLQISGLTEKDLVFKFKRSNFSRVFNNSRKKIKKFKLLSKYLYNQRNWNKISEMYLFLLKLNK